MRRKFDMIFKIKQQRRLCLRPCFYLINCFDCWNSLCCINLVHNTQYVHPAWSYETPAVARPVHIRPTAAASHEPSDHLSHRRFANGVSLEESDWVLLLSTGGEVQHETKSVVRREAAGGVPRPVMCLTHIPSPAYYSYRDQFFTTHFYQILAAVSCLRKVLYEFCFHRNVVIQWSISRK